MRITALPLGSTQTGHLATTTFGTNTLLLGRDMLPRAGRAAALAAAASTQQVVIVAEDPDRVPARAWADPEVEVMLVLGCDLEPRGLDWLPLGARLEQRDDGPPVLHEIGRPAVTLR